MSFHVPVTKSTFKNKKARKLRNATGVLGLKFANVIVRYGPTTYGYYCCWPYP